MNDKESYAYRVGDALGAEYQVYNLGVSACGPHQMLALLESDRLDAIFRAHDTVHVYFFP